MLVLLLAEMFVWRKNLQSSEAEQNDGISHVDFACAIAKPAAAMIFLVTIFSVHNVQGFTHLLIMRKRN